MYIYIYILESNTYINAFYFIWLFERKNTKNGNI